MKEVVLPEFQKYLLTRKLVKKKKVPFYAYWTSKFLTFSNSHERENIRGIQELLGHKSVETTMIYTHVIRDMSNVPKSPLDNLYKKA